MEARSKAQTFIGFAMRKGKYKIGANACCTLKRAFLIIICCTASENAVKEGMKLGRSFNAKVIRTTQNPLSFYVARDNAKIMAISDREFARLIFENKEKEFIELEQENING